MQLLSFVRSPGSWHRSFPRARLWQVGVYAAFWLQLLMFTTMRGHFGPYWSPVALGAAGALLSIFALLYFRDQPWHEAPAQRTARRLPWAVALLLLGGLWVLRYQAPIIAANPVNVYVSDIVPVLQNFTTRFLSGEVVYRYLTNLPYPLFPNYLPWQWLPYTLAEAWGIDYRWWALGLLLLAGFGAWQVTLARRPIGGVEYVLKALLPAFILVRMVRHDNMLFAHVVEPTIIAYYCLLAASVLSRSVLVQALALTLCLLSRYSVVFWVPLYFVILWFEAGRWHTVRVGLLVLAGIVGCYVIPFLSQDWTIFTHALSEYRGATLGEWGHNLNAAGQPYHLFNGLGLAAWSYTYAPGDLAQKIAWAQRLHVLASAGTALGFGLLYWRWRKRIDYRYLALVALQGYLLVFYLFLQTPYAYLTSLTLFMSAFVVMAVGGRPAGTAPAQPASSGPLNSPTGAPTV